MANILIVDDSTIYRASMREILESAGHTVVGEASDGEEAIEQYKELRPDITTLDITMPVMNGIEALKEIMKFDSDAKIVMVSSTAQQNTIAEALISGAYDFFPKPLDSEQIMESLDSIFI